MPRWLFTRAAILLCMAVTVCCGCSSGSDFITTPPTRGTAHIDSRIDIDGSIETDLRCLGIRESVDSSDSRTETPIWPRPHCYPPEFDGVLSCTLMDPQQELPIWTLSCIIDGTYDLSDSIRYEIEILPTGERQCNWWSEVPEVLIDNNEHFLDISVASPDGYPMHYYEKIIFDRIIPPGIGTVFYPYRDLTIPPELQGEPDYTRILVGMDGDFLVEWKDYVTDLFSTWKVDGIGMVDVVDFDWPRKLITLQLPSPLEENTTLYFGPVDLGDGLIAEDSEYMPGIGGLLELFPLSSDCDCNYIVRELEEKDPDQAESNAWCTEIDYPDANACRIFLDTSGGPGPPPTYASYVEREYIKNMIPEIDFYATGDPWTLHDPVIIPFTSSSPVSGGVQTTRPGRYANHHIHKEYYVLDDDDLVCASGLILDADFDTADVTNPQFANGSPALMSGPDAGAWLRTQSERDDCYNMGPLVAQLIAAAEGDTCDAVYLTIDWIDDMSAFHSGISGWCIDYIDQDGVHFNYGPFGGALGAHLNFDHDPEYDSPGEKYQWIHDPAYQDHQNTELPMLPPGWLATDRQREWEEEATIWEITDLVRSCTDIRLRISDRAGNWTRSGNLINTLPAGTYDFIELGIHTKDENGNDELAEFCASRVRGQVYPNPELDVAVQVHKTDPLVHTPPHIEVEVDCPTDESGIPSQTITVSLYPVWYGSSRHIFWSDLFGNPPADPCNEVFYARGDYLHLPKGAMTSSCQEIVVTDNVWSSTAAPVDYSHTPYLYLSDSDHLLGTEGDPVNKEWMDYTQIFSNDTTQHNHYYGGTTGYYFGDNPPETRRGSFVQGCPNSGTGPADDDKNNDWIDVRNGGVEQITVHSPDVGETDDIAWRSRGDLMFIWTHGAHDTTDPSNDTPSGVTDDAWSFYGPLRDRIGPFANPPPYSACYGAPRTHGYMMYYEWAAVGGDVNWIATCSCGILNDRSWPYWSSLVSLPYKSICGYRADHYRSDPGGPTIYFGDYSYNLTHHYGVQQHPDYWYYCSSSEPSIVSWMENACDHCNRSVFPSVFATPGSITGSALRAAAVDNINRFIISKRWNLHNYLTTGYWTSYVIKIKN